MHYNVVPYLPYYILLYFISSSGWTEAKPEGDLAQIGWRLDRRVYDDDDDDNVGVRLPLYKRRV